MFGILADATSAPAVATAAVAGLTENVWPILIVAVPIIGALAALSIGLNMIFGRGKKVAK